MTDITTKGAEALTLAADLRIMAKDPFHTSQARRILRLAADALAAPAAAPQPRTDWQQRCLDKGFQYVRASDDHYVIASVEQMRDLLRDVLGVEVELAASAPPPAAPDAVVEPIGGGNVEAMLLRKLPEGTLLYAATAQPPSPDPSDVMKYARGVAKCWEFYRWSRETSDAIESLCAALSTATPLQPQQPVLGDSPAALSDVCRAASELPCGGSTSSARGTVPDGFVLISHFDHCRLAYADSQMRLASSDAERYRWLRSRDLDTISKGGIFAGKTPDNIVLNGEDLDAAINAELEKETP